MSVGDCDFWLSGEFLRIWIESGIPDDKVRWGRTVEIPWSEETKVNQLWIWVPGSINSHWFPLVGDGHKPNSSGLYTHYKDSLLKVGWVYPQYKEWITDWLCSSQNEVKREVYIYSSDFLCVTSTFCTSWCFVPMTPWKSLYPSGRWRQDKVWLKRWTMCWRQWSVELRNLKLANQWESLVSAPSFEQRGCLTVSSFQSNGVSIHHPLGFNWHLFKVLGFRSISIFFGGVEHITLPRTNIAP